MSQRFTIDHDLNRWDAHLGEYQGEAGVTLLWYRWDPESDVDDVYDVGAPRQWGPAIEVPALFVLPVEGSHVYADRGLKTNNSVVFAIAKDVFRDRLGWGEELERGRFHQKFMKDRVSYEGWTFTIDVLEPNGDLGGRDVVISGGGRQVRDDVLFVDEPAPAE